MTMPWPRPPTCNCSGRHHSLCPCARVWNWWWGRSRSSWLGPPLLRGTSFSLLLPFSLPRSCRAVPTHDPMRCGIISCSHEWLGLVGPRCCAIARSHMHRTRASSSIGKHAKPARAPFCVMPAREASVFRGLPIPIRLLAPSA